MSKNRKMLKLSSIILFLTCMLCAGIGSGLQAAVRDDVAAQLRMAAMCGELADLERLVQEVSNLDARSHLGRSALCCAAWYDQLDAVRLLVRWGADIETTDNTGCTPLHVASLRGHIDVVQFLVSEGARIDIAASNGCRPLHAAAQGGHPVVVEFLVSMGARIDAAANNGYTPLHQASWAGELHVVQGLIALGADSDAAGNNGYTPLHVAACRGKLHVVQGLIALGADSNAAGDNGCTPLAILKTEQLTDLLRICIFESDQECYKVVRAEQERRKKYKKKPTVIFKRKKSSNRDSKRDICPLHEASKMGNIKMMKFLRGLGCSFLALDDSARLPFHVAMQAGQWGAARYLFSLGLPSSVFGAKTNELLDVKSVKQVDGRVLTNAILQFLFGFPYQKLLDKHTNVPDYFMPSNGSVGKRISDKLLEKVKASYEWGIWHVLPDDLKLRILIELARKQFGFACRNLSENQATLLSLLFFCDGERFDQMRNRLNYFLRRRGCALSIDTEHFVHGIFRQPLPPVATAFIGSRLKIKNKMG